MPIYEYECSNCHHQFDLLQKISELPVKQCPACQNDTAERLVSAAGFQLKGTGWYVTDFKNKKEVKPTATPTENKTTTASKETEQKK